MRQNDNNNQDGRRIESIERGIDVLEDVHGTELSETDGTDEQQHPQKEHYDLRRVNARTKLTEILYIFFGIHTTNVVQLADRIEQRAQMALT